MKKLLIVTATLLALSTQGYAMAADTTAKTTVGQKFDDAKIVTVVNADLVKDKDLSAVKINVDSTQGKVVLRGTAPSATAKARAESIAKGVNGVVSVDNQLMVGENSTTVTSTKTMDTTYNSNKTNQAYDNTKANVKDAAHDMNTSAKNTAHKAGNKLDDAAINVAIHTVLADDSELSSMKTNVDVKNGKVWLKGTAPNMAAKKRATDIAKSVEGVTSVTNQLVVSSK